MNSKKAKALRKLANHLATEQGFPEKDYFKKSYKSKQEVMFDREGGGYRVVMVKKETLMLTENCERKIYKQLKRGYDV